MNINNELNILSNLYNSSEHLFRLSIELAVKGKLNEGSKDSAMELLNTINNERDNEKSKIRGISFKTLEYEEIKEEPYSIPKNWKWVKLGCIGRFFNGNSISANAKKQKYTNEFGLPFIATKDIGYGFEKFDYENGISIPKGEAKFKLAKKGTVFICAEGGSAGKKCGVSESDLYFGNKLFACEPYANINPYYLLCIYLSDEFYTQFSNAKTGIIGGVSLSKFLEIKIPLPPLIEQEQIVNSK